MTDSPDPRAFASQLLRQDGGWDDREYRAYRARLERALAGAERRERVVFLVCSASCVAMVTLMFVGGTGVLGEFDPWSKGATAWSVAAAVAYVLSTAVFFLSIASYYSRFRPRSKRAREQLREASILELQGQLREMRNQIGPS